jgi:hypothetical protein
VVTRGRARQVVEGVAHGGRELLPVADGAEVDVVLEELVALGEEVVLEERHERIDLFPWTPPVLLREGVEGELFEAEATSGAHDATNGVAASAVTGGAGLPPEFGPTAVAIHGDGDVAREVSGVDERHRGVLEALSYMMRGDE